MSKQQKVSLDVPGMECMVRYRGEEGKSRTFSVSDTLDALGLSTPSKWIVEHKEMLKRNGVGLTGVTLSGGETYFCSAADMLVVIAHAPTTEKTEALKTAAMRFYAKALAGELGSTQEIRDEMREASRQQYLESYRPSRDAIRDAGGKPYDYMNAAKLENILVFGEHRKGIRDTATPRQLRKLALITEEVGEKIDELRSEGTPLSRCFNLKHHKRD